MNPLLVPVIGIALTAAVAGASVGRDARATAKGRRDAQRAEAAEAADTARQEADQIAERDRQLARVAADQQRARLLARVDRFGVPEFLQSLLLRNPWAARAESLSERRTASTEDIAESTAELEARVAEVQANRVGSNRPLSIGAAVLWLLMSLMLLYLDWELLTSQGLHGTLAAMLAAGLTLTIEVLGIVVWSALGVHAVDLLADSRRWVRRTTSMLAVVAVATLLAVVMLPLAASRAEEVFGHELRSAQATLAAAESGGQTVAIETATQHLAEIQGRFDRSTLMNQGLTTGLALGVVLLSWSPFAFADHRRVQQAKDRLKVDKDARRAIDAEQAQFDADFTDFAAGVLDDVDLNPNDVRMLLTIGAPQSAPRSAPQGGTGLQGGPGDGNPTPAEPPAAFPPPPSPADTNDVAASQHVSFADDLPNPFDLFPQGGNT